MGSMKHITSLPPLPSLPLLDVEGGPRLNQINDPRIGDVLELNFKLFLLLLLLAALLPLTCHVPGFFRISLSCCLCQIAPYFFTFHMLIGSLAERILLSNARKNGTVSAVLFHPRGGMMMSTMILGLLQLHQSRIWISSLRHVQSDR